MTYAPIRHFALAMYVLDILPEPWQRVAARSLSTTQRYVAGYSIRNDETTGFPFAVWSVPHKMELEGPRRLFAALSLMAAGVDQSHPLWGIIDSGLPLDSEEEQRQWEEIAALLATECDGVAELMGWAIGPERPDPEPEDYDYAAEFIAYWEAQFEAAMAETLNNYPRPVRWSLAGLVPVEEEE